MDRIAMNALGEYERQLRDVCFLRDAHGPALRALGGPADRWLTYRRIVRFRLDEAIAHALPRLREVVGGDAFRALSDRFFAEKPPRSAYLREVPGEFVAWLIAAAAVPPSACDLARYEWAELGTAYLPDGPTQSRGRAVVDLDMSRPAALAAAHTVLALAHPVHRDERAEATDACTFVCVYRDPGDHQVRTLELSRFAARLLGRIAVDDAPLADLVRGVAADLGERVDAPFVDALSVLLADLVDRGILLGSFA